MRRVFNSSQQQLIILIFSWIYCEGIIERLISRSAVKGSDLKGYTFHDTPINHQAYLCIIVMRCNTILGWPWKGAVDSFQVGGCRTINGPSRLRWVGGQKVRAREREWEREAKMLWIIIWLALDWWGLYNVTQNIPKFKMFAIYKADCQISFTHLQGLVRKILVIMLVKILCFFWYDSIRSLHTICGFQKQEREAKLNIHRESLP